MCEPSIGGIAAVSGSGVARQGLASSAPRSLGCATAAFPHLADLQSRQGSEDMLSNFHPFGRPMGRPWHGSHASSLPVDQ